jgi:SAM-dependent methyltransferase
MDKLFDLFMYPLEAAALRKRRRSLMRKAQGRTLEIGAGTGANFAYYRWDRINEIDVLDLSVGQAVRSYDGANGTPFHWHEGDVERLPFASGVFDTVVSTLVFCSVHDPARGLSEVRRVLNTGGTLIFIEHVRPHRQGFARVTDALNPLWHTLSGECNINRDTLRAIEKAGFVLRRTRRSTGGLLIDGTATRV